MKINNMKRFKLLSIGNSFSDDAHAYLYDLLKMNGFDDVKIANLYIGGCTLEKHVNNAINDIDEYCLKVYDENGYTETYQYTIKKALEEEYDYITFQQASYASGQEHSFIIDKTKYNVSENTYIDYLFNYVKDNYKHKNNPKFYYHLTWAYEKGFKDDTFSIYNYNQKLMEDSIKKCYKKYIANDTRFDSVIMNTLLVSNLRQIELSNVTRDGFHLSFRVGRLTAAFGFYYFILKEVPKVINPIKDLTYNEMYSALSSLNETIKELK